MTEQVAASEVMVGEEGEGGIAKAAAVVEAASEGMDTEGGEGGAAAKREVVAEVVASEGMVEEEGIITGGDVEAALQAKECLAQQGKQTSLQERQRSSLRVQDFQVMVWIVQGFQIKLGN